MESHLRTELVVDALEMAVWRRRPAPGLIHHSDQGVQYTALSFGKRLEQVGIVPSMGRVGSALDNALSESFVATLKAELVSRAKFPSREIARVAIFEYLEAFYNRTRGYTPRLATEARRTSRRIECENLRQRKRSVSVVAGEFQPLRQLACSPEPIAASASKGRPRFRQGHPPQADLLRLSGTRKGLLARGDHPHLGSPGQCPRAFRAPRTRRGNFWLIIGDRNYHSPKTRRELAGTLVCGASGPVFLQEEGPHPEKERLPQSASLPDRHRFQPAHRALLRKEGVGARPLASGKQTAAQSPLSHRGLPAQPSDGQSTPTALKATHLKNPHIGLRFAYDPDLDQRLWRRIEGMNERELGRIVRALSVHFQLNVAERYHRVRRRREYEPRDDPRSERRYATPSRASSRKGILDA